MNKIDNILLAERRLAGLCMYCGKQYDVHDTMSGETKQSYYLMNYNICTPCVLEKHYPINNYN